MNTTSIKNIFIFSLGIILSGSFVYYEQTKNIWFNDKISNLKSELIGLSTKIESIKNEDAKEFLALKETIKKESDSKKTQDELLTSAVSKSSPAVVSIVVSKDIQKYEITYQNPFGDDPHFRGLQLRIPILTPKGTERQKVGAGTGFIIRKDGYILTNKHVAGDDNAEYTVFLSTGEQKTAALIYKDSDKDISILKILADNLPVIKLGDYSNVKLGQTVIAIGNALGEYNNSVSVGIISGLDRTIQAKGNGTMEELKGVIQTDAAINPGNSGGPLVNLNGEAIGINVATAIDSSNISFSIPIDEVKKLIGKVVKL